MDAKDKLLKAIEEFLGEYARWARRAGGSRSDAVEEFYRELLNRAFGYQLKNMNREKGNYPGIDLADDAAGVAVQVTTTEKPEKVRHTLEQFLDAKKGLYSRYTRLIVAVAGDSKGKNSSYTTKDFDFQPRRDIWDIGGLVTELCALPQEKLEDLEEFLKKRTAHLPVGDPVLQLPTPERRSSVEFLGREEELAWIEEELRRGTKPVIVAGLGGIGKTVLAVKFRRRWEGHVYFATFRESFQRTLADSVGMAIPVQERQGLNEEQTAELALGYLSRCEAGDLLIVDNAEVTGKKWRDLTKDPFYEKLRRLPMNVLMTTRHRDTGGRWLGRMAQEELREIFRRHEVNIPEGEMDRLIDAVDGHTMTVDMIARTIRESWGDVTAEDILTAMADSTLHEGDFDEIETDHDPEQRQIYAHLRALFDLSGISEDGKYALRCATLLPQNGMDEALFRHALTEGAAKAIKLLEKKGWVDRKEGKVTIHPVVRLVCRTELKPTEENCKAFLHGIRGQYDRKQYDHVKFRQMAEVFETASNLLEDKTGFWAGEAGYFWSEVAETQRALACTLRSVQMREQHQPDSNSLATSYNNVSATYYALGDHEQALEYNLKALAIYERVLPPEHPDLAHSYNNVCATYYALGDHKQALEYQRKALAIFVRVLPPEHPDLALSYDNVGLIYGALGDHRQALEYQLKALEIRERVLPPEHPDLALSYNSVCVTYYALGDHKQALEHQLKTLAIFERVLPPEHPSLATSYNNVGSTYYAQDNYEKALEYQQKALMIRERVLPGNHPDLAMAYANVAMDYELLNNITEAATHMRRAAEIINRSTLPETHPNRVNYNEWADRLEREAQQAQSAEKHRRGDS